MIFFTGEYDCKIDGKGRMMLPVAFRRMLPEAEVYTFVIKRDMYVSCLELYTYEEWERQNKLILSAIQPYNPEHRQFMRDFRMGAAEVELDSCGRMLLPQRLLTSVGIEREVILAGGLGKIEIWESSRYNNGGGTVEERQQRAERVMGNIPEANAAIKELIP